MFMACYEFRMSRIEFEDDTMRIRFLDGFRRGPNFPKESAGNEAFVKVPGRRIKTAVVHHSAGGFYEGIHAVERLADFCIAPPRYKLDDLGVMLRDKHGKPIIIGGGRGWPGIPYTYVIPAYPASEDGRLVVYKIWDDDWSTWHTGGLYNQHGIGIVVGGWYASKHDLLASAKDSRAHAKPTEEAMTCLDRLVDFVMARHQLKLGVDTLKSHAELGKPACPGGYLENWVRVRRGEDEIVELTPGHEDQRPLNTTEQVQRALVELGYDPGKVDGAMGPFTMHALKAFQLAERLRPDGIFGPITRQAMRLALAR